MNSLVHDIRYGARMLWKSKGLTAVALVSLAAGIGGNAAIFSVAHSILFRPRAVLHPDELVAGYAGYRDQPWQGLSYPSYLDLRERTRTFSGLAAYKVASQFTLTGKEDVEQVWGEVVSGNYFEVLGVPFLQGRGFLPDEDQVPNRNPVVVIGAGLWQRRYSSDPALVGKTITVNNVALTVTGIVSPRYNGMLGGWASELWVPAMMTPALDPSRGMSQLSRDDRGMALIGRLKPGLGLADARTEVDVLVAGIKQEHRDEWVEAREEGAAAGKAEAREKFISLLPERETRVHPSVRGAMYGVAALLFVIVDLVLLIACINLASMLFARAVSRRSEIAVRLAIGAGRGRIVRQLLIESVLLSLVAGVAGTALALWGLKGLAASLPVLAEGVRFAVDLRIDWRVLLYSLGFATVTGVLFGLAPAVHASRASLSSVLKDESTITARFRRSRVRQGLLAAQVAFSLLLLIGAGLVLRSLEKARPTRLGFSTDRMLLAQLRLDENRYDRRAVQQFYLTLSERVASLPGVQSVSLVEGVPGGVLSRTRRSVDLEGRSREIDASIVGPRYFTNLAVPFVAGRDFTARDRTGTPCVAIVNEVFMTRYLAGSALGKQLTQTTNKPGAPRSCEIVGVVRDNAWQSLNEEVRPFFALPLLQTEQRRMTMLVQTGVEPERLVSGVRQTIRGIDPGIPPGEIRPLAEHFRVALYPFRLLGMVLAGSGILALLLALVGIYGVVSHSVAQRRRELGIRIAMGAMNRDVLRLVIGQGMRPVALGLCLGLGLGLAFTRLLSAIPLEIVLLFGVSTTDAVAFGGVTLLLAMVAFAACFLPAHRATRVDPTTILKEA